MQERGRFFTRERFFINGAYFESAVDAIKSGLAKESSQAIEGIAMKSSSISEESIQGNFAPKFGSCTGFVTEKLLIGFLMNGASRIPSNISWMGNWGNFG
eukprot:7878486-Ditylum_brightwellii.AAC.1